MKYVALLRGINVGGNNKVEMKKLKLVLENADFESVSTYINSGNVILETDETENIEQKIEVLIQINFGILVPVLIRNSEEILALNNIIPKDWTNDSTTQKTDVLFLWEECNTPKVLDSIIHNPDVDNLIYIPEAGAIVWNVARADYKFGGMDKFAGSKIYKSMTARNVNTVRKLAELMIDLPK